MRKLITLLSIFFITACAAQNAAMSAPAQKVEAQQEFESPTAEPPTMTATALLETETATATLVPPAMTPTETPLPPLELPTPLANPPALLAWDGTPTYLGDSKPDYLFRVRYDPEIWALTTDSYGYPAIGHRGIEYCVIAPAFGRGLPSNTTVEHDIRKIGVVEFEINTVFRGGVRQSVTYLGGDTNIYTGFEVTFAENADLCLQEAEMVFATFTSVKVTQATPVP
ncbi:MAG TPA: hypothetical protein PKE35_14390 [Anaerolineales bacterium]|nr:hypothetical protein [Anaerolineales bacterium]HMV97501.1 hypothetical protein [Anaerolineales bacterium]HMX20550.1 hypothetical protein [Anaerolineales bacterium]HMX75440.1 hypothetical protein [Anaerolineales bacterium]HNB86808.1 hypothetical protein [Anaerolineales bacterium]